MREEKSIKRTYALDISLIALFAALTAVGAYIWFPLPISPVPITLQTLFVYLAGIILGSRLASLSQVLYICLGVVGLPVFSGGKAGLGVLLGPTGGYLIGFIIAGYVIGKMVESKNKCGYVWILISLIVGTAVIYVLGVIQLSVWMNIGLDKAVFLGTLPFLVGDALKIAVALYVGNSRQIKLIKKYIMYPKKRVIADSA
jgi:biotin transport system substrate-specific component